MLIAPAQSVEEICKDPQLEAREYWQDVEHPELGDTITYCGAPIKLSEASWQIRRRAPLIGEHNQEVYDKDLGLSRNDVVRLEKEGVI